MDYLLSNISNVLITVGLIIIIIEIFIPAIGFLFAGIALIITGCFTNLKYIDNNFYSQICCFFISSFLGAIIFWIPLKKILIKENKINNLVGEKVFIVSDNISCNAIGKVIWSNTIFNAKLIEGTEPKSKNTEVEIVDIKGNILIVK